MQPGLCFFFPTPQLIDDVEWESVTAAPESGCYIRGLYLEGARYDPTIKALNDSLPKQLYTLLPVMHLDPIKDRPVTTSHVYRCPVYKILSRQGACCAHLFALSFLLSFVGLVSPRPHCLHLGHVECAVLVRGSGR